MLSAFSRAHNRSFQALSERDDRGAIDLDDLEPDSPLATMLTLSSLCSNGGPLDKVRFLT